MIKFNYILFLVAISLVLWSCEKAEVIPEMNYNRKANELILQVISEEEDPKCNCILEIPKESMVEIIKLERPFQFLAIRKDLIKDLELNDESSLDSLIKVSNNFSLNEDLLNQKNIKLITHKMLDSARKNKWANFFEICPNGYLFMQKPIFDKYYKTAVINVGYAGTCSPGSIRSYKFNDGKWISK
ncbi:hypothetical protein EKL32_28580 [Flavobacterium sp. GSN2]|nr:hypothetical protein EKL32_28580 [Flavobacterium sp. GSN2]